MFFIFGINNEEKNTDISWQAVCPVCGRLSRVFLVESYMVFSLFFIPLIKWNRRYRLQMQCCGGVSEIDKALGESLKRHETEKVDIERLIFNGGRREKHCRNCGAFVQDDFAFCPKCGSAL